jgi:dTMP kinase
MNLPSMPGRFIAIEGTDGAGTSTQGDLLAQWLVERGLEVLRLAQPSHLEGGQLIRRILRHELGVIDAATVALLFAADRVDLCERVIAPALARGAWVVCDRHLGSSLAFQVVDGAGGIDPDWLLAVNSKALTADLTLWIDVPVPVALQRIAARGKPIERFEVAATLERVRARYAEVARQPPAQLGAIATIDGQPARDVVAYAIRTQLLDALAVPELR